MRNILLILITSLGLYASSYNSTSFYIAYDGSDATKYALVMPSVNKVYTHIAGHVLPSDLTDITDQFESFPSNSSGDITFSSLTSSATDSEAAVMAGNTYECLFFYVQKEAATGGYAFLLYYKPASILYEGLAGQSTSFKVVKDANGIYNSESISSDDYTNFYFNLSSSTAYLGQDAVDAYNAAQISMSDLTNDADLSSIPDRESLDNKSIITAQDNTGAVQFYLTTFNNDTSYKKVQLSAFSAETLDGTDQEVTTAVASQVSALSSGWCGTALVDSTDTMSMTAVDSAIHILNDTTNVFDVTYSGGDGNLTVDSISSTVVWYGDSIALDTVTSCQISGLPTGVTEPSSLSVPPQVPQ